MVQGEASPDGLLGVVRAVLKLGGGEQPSSPSVLGCEGNYQDLPRLSLFRSDVVPGHVRAGIDQPATFAAPPLSRSAGSSGECPLGRGVTKPVLVCLPLPKVETEPDPAFIVSSCSATASRNASRSW